jgi:hypothetical protein
MLRAARKMACLTGKYAISLNPNISHFGTEQTLPARTPAPSRRGSPTEEKEINKQ